MDKFKQLALKCFHAKQEKPHGWPQNSLDKTMLLLLLFLSSTTAQAVTQSQAGNFSLKPSDILFRAITPLALLLIAHAIIPIVKAWLDRRSQKKSFLGYLRANVNSGLARYQQEISVDYAARHLGFDDKYEEKWPEWLQLLKSHGGVPKLLVQLHETMEKAMSDEAHEEKYYPFLSYTGMPTADINHDHLMWGFDEKATDVISAYLVSQRQVVASVKEHYEPPFFKLIESDDKRHRLRWCNVGIGIGAEMAEHYLNALRLKHYLEHHV